MKHPRLVWRSDLPVTRVAGTQRHYRQGDEDVKLSREEQALAAQVSAERLWDFTVNIAQKVRLSGSPDERDSFRYIAKTLKRWGF